MLVLSRRKDESLKIADNITVTILGIVGNQVRIGIEAPPEIDIHREEVFNRIHGQVAFCSGSPEPFAADASDRRYLVPPDQEERHRGRRTALGLRTRQPRA